LYAFSISQHPSAIQAVPISKHITTRSESSATDASQTLFSIAHSPSTRSPNCSPFHPLVIPQSKYPHSPQHRPSTKDSAPSKIFRQTIASATPTPPMPTPPTSPHKIAIQGSPPRDRGAAAAPPRTCCAHVLEGGHRVIGGE